jgi:hypothetical protein
MFLYVTDWKKVADIIILKENSPFEVIESFAELNFYDWVKLSLVFLF